MTSLRPWKSLKRKAFFDGVWTIVFFTSQQLWYFNQPTRWSIYKTSMLYDSTNT
uniref:Uncharacterized protein n=1 Tax=Rhizophora mucronata TaxID=61149 RepID=A0A2P2M231_RHIMU